MNYFKYHYYFFILFFFKTLAIAETFTTIGHTQYLVNDNKKYQLFIKNLNSLNTDYIFFLGDSKLGNPDIFEGLNDEIRKKIFSVPGNGEYKDGIQSYIDNVGYLNKDIESKNLIYLLLDSNQPLEEVKKILNYWKKKYEKIDKKVILLTHHRIWDDSIISAQPFKHDKSFYFRDIYFLLKDFVDYIIAGNSKRQYFQDLPESLKNNQPPNISTTYWEENFQDIKAYNIGMGNGLPYASFVSFTFLDNFLIPKSQTYKLSEEGIDKMGLLRLELYSPIIRDIENKKLNLIDKVIIYVHKYFYIWLSFIAGIFFFYIVIFIKKFLTQRNS